MGIYPELEKRGFSSVILSDSPAAYRVPTLRIEPARAISIWRRIRLAEQAGFKLHGFSMAKRLRFFPSPFAFDDAIVGLSKHLREFDVVLAFETYRASTYQACMVHPRVVVKVTENLPNHPASLPHAQFRRTVRDRARRFVCVSESARDALLVEGVDERKVSVIPEPVDTNLFKPVRSPRSGDTAFVVGFAGRLDQSHGIRDLLEAFAGLPDDVHPRLKIAGTGAWGSELPKFVKSRDLESRVEYRGLLDHASMPSFMDDIDVLCVPCRETPEWKPQFGIVNIEAMSSEVPIVGTRCGATPEIVPPDLLPFLVSPGDIRSLRDRLLDLACNPELRVRLGRRAREWVLAHFEIGSVADRWASLLAEVCDGRREGPRE